MLRCSVESCRIAWQVGLWPQFVLQLGTSSRLMKSVMKYLELDSYFCKVLCWLSVFMGRREVEFGHSQARQAVVWTSVDNWHQS